MEVHQEDQVKGSKGKRTKRQRTMSPFQLTMTTSSSCSSGGDGVFGDTRSPYSSGFDRVNTLASPSNSGELTQSSVEEEDMANCLILLAQGQAQKSTSSQLPAKSVVVHHDDVYQCKTCNRCFPSFQALGGHRASHKKPKPTLLEEKNDQSSLLGHQIKDDDTTLSLQIPIRSKDFLCSTQNNTNNKARVHECSLCGAEFNSGQALGGHMRRHRPLPVVTNTNNIEGSHEEAVKKPRTLLSLDLNLPAPDQPEDDDHFLESKYPFVASKEQVIVYSASHPLVDCHY
ncbi:hypothetical protein ACH5RR_005517 [Cinchona calisaya]|uniref:C2H2-type domain-containing protein n=1 Tax=Cinchona calisaya TaxID=153742 RepID=A0ABD3ALN6_9GENT